jgi:methyl-accepting chemotaxis protein
LQLKEDIKVSLDEINDQIVVIADKNIEIKKLEERVSEMSQQVDQYKDQIIQVEQESAKKAEALELMKMDIKDL